MNLKDAIHEARGRSWIENQPMYVAECGGKFFAIRYKPTRSHIRLVCVIRSRVWMP